MKKLAKTKRTSRKSYQQRKLRSESQFEIVEPRAREAQKRAQIREAQKTGEVHLVCLLVDAEIISFEETV
jgi:hypothetical protein